MGDLGNIVSTNLNAVVSLSDSMATLSAIAGRAIVVHAGEDDYGLGTFNDSKTTGHAGARLACCVISTGASTPILAPAATPTSTMTMMNTEATGALVSMNYYFFVLQKVDLFIIINF